MIFRKLFVVFLLFSFPVFAQDNGDFDSYIVVRNFEVIDGDTIEAISSEGTFSIRFWGVDAPEKNTEPGRISKSFLEKFLKGHVLYCYPKGLSYNRIVAKCYVDERRNEEKDISRILVETNHAYDCPKYSNGYYSRYGESSRAAKCRVR